MRLQVLPIAPDRYYGVPTVKPDEIDRNLRLKVLKGFSRIPLEQLNLVPIKSFVNAIN